jgi:chemotaxis protein histidine kinase CheA
VVADRVTVAEDQVAQNGDGQTIEWQNQQLPLLRLGDLLTTVSTPGNGAPRSVLICQPGEHRPNAREHQTGVALVVDAIAGQQETLVRSLGAHASLWHGITGAAELLDGSVALMIDVARLLEANENGLA